MKSDTSEGQFAGYYDLFFNPVLNRVHKKIIFLAKKYDCENIIDLGCGTGQQARALSTNGFSVTGVDASRNMIAVAKEKSDPSITFIHETIQAVSLDVNSFDTANLSLVLHPNPERIIHGIIKKTIQLVKNNGIIFITDYGHGTGFSGRFANGLIQIIESFAGQNHRNNYFSFRRNRGLELISTHPPLQIIERCFYFHGALQTIVFRLLKD